MDRTIKIRAHEIVRTLEVIPVSPPSAHESMKRKLQ